jgi:site-specific recombinase XerD
MAAPSVSHVRAEAASLLKSYERHLRAERKSQATLNTYLTSCQQFLEFCGDANLPDLGNITREHIELWLERLHETYRPHSVRIRLVGLRCWLRWLYAEGEIERDPTARMRLPGVDEVEKDVVSGEDVGRALRILEKAKRDRDAAIIAVLYDTGLRASELASLKLDRVNLDTGICFIEKSKNHRTRVVKISPAGIRYVDRYLRRRRDPFPVYLFEGKKGPLTRSGVYRVVTRAFAAAGIKATIGAHDMRHSSATAASSELSESDMMQLYGWSSAEMARHYARQALQANALKAHDRASPLSRLPGGAK